MIKGKEIAYAKERRHLGSTEQKEEADILLKDADAREDDIATRAERKAMPSAAWLWRGAG